VSPLPSPVVPLDIIPILSYIFLRGHCRSCRAKISPQYPLIELAGGISALIILFPLLTMNLNSAAGAILDLVIVITLIVLFTIDLRTLLLPDKYIIFLTVVVVARLLTTHYSLLTTNYQLFTTTLLGAAIGSGLLGLLWLITRGRGLGLGDVKLMIPLGLLFGYIDTAWLLLTAFFIGGLLAAGLLAAKKVTMKTAVPFGPFLAGAAILFILWPDLPRLLTTLILGNSFII